MQISFTTDNSKDIDGKIKRSNLVKKTKVYKATFEEFDNVTKAENEEMPMSFLADLATDIVVELGRTSKTAKEILKLEKGSIIALNKSAGENVDILLNKEFFAKGEVVVLDETYGVRITSIIKE